MFTELYYALEMWQLFCGDKEIAKIVEMFKCVIVVVVFSLIRIHIWRDTRSSSGVQKWRFLQSLLKILYIYKKKIIPQVGWEKTIWKCVQWNSMKHHFFFKMFLKEVLFSEQLWQFILLYLEQVKM